MADKSERSRLVSCWKWMKSPTFYIYLNFFLGAWGDRMWQFSVGLYLVTLAGGILRLAAIYSLSASCSFLLFGGILGNWVDKTGRLKVVRVTLVVQNFSVMLSAVGVALALSYTDKIYSHTGLSVLTEIAIIFFAVIAQIASMTYHIAIEKDWIVNVASGDHSTLANLNAVIRSIDLSCKILAPTVCGVIMQYTSMFISALVIVGWNIVSVFLEYGLLSKVYRMVPALAVKAKNQPEEKEKKNDASIEEKEKLTTGGVQEYEPEKEEVVTEVTELNDTTESPSKPENPAADKCEKSKKKNKNCVELMIDPFVTLVRSWKIYSKQPVAFAGLSLSFLYMTVLGFDSITVGFIYFNGVSELVTGISMALAGLFGIFGTFAYTIFRKRIGLERTGLFSYTLEITCLVLCVLSVFTPGSHFDPNFNPWTNTSTCVVADPTESPLNLNKTHLNDGVHDIVRRNIQGMASREALPYFMDDANREMSMSYILSASQSHGFPNVGFLSKENVFGEGELSFSGGTRHSGHIVKKRNAVEKQNDNTTESENACNIPLKYNGFNYSVVLLLIGIVTSRIGLWMSDLVVTQTLQENVAEHERGTVNGIQGSLNMLMDILKNVLVIVIPYIQTFGYLIIVSFLFICAAGGLFCFHSYRVRGHLFHCHKVWCCCCDNMQQKRGVENGSAGMKETAAAIEDIQTCVVEA